VKASNWRGRGLGKSYYPTHDAVCRATYQYTGELLRSSWCAVMGVRGTLMVVRCGGLNVAVEVLEVVVVDG